MIRTNKFTGFLADNLLRRNPARGGPRRIPPDQHHIQPDQIHPTIRTIVETLEGHGFTAWIIGGAVRDLLLERAPKDFDLATDARPEEVKNCFPNARIIGRRFRLVHLEYPGMTVEVATFRARPGSSSGQMIRRDNTYGTPEEDAFRRDFTVNALAFDVGTFSVIDYVGGLTDLEHKTLRTISRPKESIREDPVRMLRAVRFMERLEFGLDPDLEKAIRQLAPSLTEAKRHRLAEETQRFLTRGSAPACMKLLDELGLLVPMLGTEQFRWVWDETAAEEPLPALSPMIKVLDSWFSQSREPVQPAVVLLAVVLSLAREELRAALLGENSRNSPARMEETNHRLSRILGDWGLLKGQVEPAMQVLEAARTVRKQAGRGAPTAKPPLGAREAWQVLLLLEKVTGLEPETAEIGRAAMEQLPAMVIPEHPPPPGRRPRQGGDGRRPRRGGRRRGAQQSGQSGVAAATPQAGAATPSKSSSRRRRRPRSSGGN